MDIYCLLEYLENYCKETRETPSFIGLKKYKKEFWR